MEAITKDEISNVQLSESVEPGDIVGKHRYEGGQVDWFIANIDNAGVNAGTITSYTAWYGAPGPEERDLDDLDVVDMWTVA